MSQFVDLHCHSTASDGTLPPADLARLAKRCGLSAFALSDHDTVAGVEDAAREAARTGIDFIPGIEISCQLPRPGTLHMLGYGITPNAPALRDLTGTLLEARDRRNPEIIRSLNELGIDVTMDDWRQEAPGGVLGRPHLAAVLVKKGCARSIEEAFDRYLGEGAPAYVDKERLLPLRAIEMIRAAGGLPVLAHPVQLRTQNLSHLETIVKQLVDQGLAGIEVIHSDHDEFMVRELTRLADRFGLLKTGGSDFHGASKPGIQLGIANGRRIPRRFYDALVEHHKSVTLKS